MSQSLRAGVAETDITPPMMGLEMCGYGWYERRVCTNVLDPIFARALWLESGDAQRVLILSVDVCAIDWLLRQEIVTEISRRTGIAPDAVMLAATHSHSSPAVQHLIGWGEPDPAYRKTLASKLVDLADRAKRDAQPAKLGFKRQRIHNVSLNREQRDVGPTDTAAQLMRVDRANGSPLAIVYNYASHPVERFPFTAKISSDFPGVIAKKMRDRFGKDVMPIYLQGACGNINFAEMIFARDDIPGSERLCDERLEEMVDRLWPQLEPTIASIETTLSGEVPLGGTIEVIDLPCRRPSRDAIVQIIEKARPIATSRTPSDLRPLPQRILNETEDEKAWRLARYEFDAYSHQLALLDRGATSEPARVQLLRTGDAAIIGWPAEVFVEFGIELRQRSPIPMTFVATYTNHTIGYIPTLAAFESQGKPNQHGVYPVQKTPLLYGHLPFESNVGRVLVEGTMKMLSDV